MVRCKSWRFRPLISVIHHFKLVKWICVSPAVILGKVYPTYKQDVVMVKPKSSTNRCMKSWYESSSRSIKIASRIIKNKKCNQPWFWVSRTKVAQEDHTYIEGLSGCLCSCFVHASACRLISVQVSLFHSNWGHRRSTRPCHLLSSYTLDGGAF